LSLSLSLSLFFTLSVSIFVSLSRERERERDREKETERDRERERRQKEREIGDKERERKRARETGFTLRRSMTGGTRRMRQPLSHGCFVKRFRALSRFRVGGGCHASVPMVRVHEKGWPHQQVAATTMRVVHA